MAKKLETIDQQAKKKKDFLIIFSIIALIGIVLGSAFFSIMSAPATTKKFTKKQTTKQKDLSLLSEKDFKENWAISIENNLEKQQKTLTDFMKKTENFQKKSIDEIKDIVFETTEKQQERAKAREEMLQKEIKKIKESINNKLKEQDLKLKEIEHKATQASLNINVPERRLPATSTTTGSVSKQQKATTNKDNLSDLLPPIEQVVNDITGSSKTQSSQTPVFGKQEKTGVKGSKQKKERFVTKKEDPHTVFSGSKSNIVSNQKPFKKFKLSSIKVDNSDYYLNLKKEQLAKLKRKEAKAKKTSSYHVMLGFTKAYMITGAYAPVLSAGTVEPLPVLMEAEGDILIANNDTENVDKCFLIGSAKGNMNSQTADIRLVKISCSINGGKKMIEGPISGWVIGEDGIPGLQGTLLHKNGALISRTFVAGFLQAFAQAFNQQSTTVVTAGGATSAETFKNSAKSAFASGSADVFSKIGDYYLKMAQQIFPVIEVKGGRTVSIILKGGENLSLQDMNKIDVLQMEEDALEEEIAELEKERYKKEIHKFDFINNKNKGANK